MKSLVLAFSFLSVPRLFLSLLLWPLAIGLFILFGQLAFSTAYFEVSDTTSEDVRSELNNTNEEEWLRELVYGSSAYLADPVVCRWVRGADGIEAPPSPACTPDPSDVVVRTSNAAEFNVRDYFMLYRGATKKIHLCADCTSNLEVFPENGKTELRSLPALGVFILADELGMRRRAQFKVDAMAEREKAEKLSGSVSFHPTALVEGVDLKASRKQMVLIVNVAFIISIGLWLALKSHRKVLDYFARNGALLPLVAACGKKDFYKALWVITLVRVLLFLSASVPATSMLFRYAFSEGDMAWKGSVVGWLLALTLGLSALGIVASIAELKAREPFADLLYKYIPAGVCFAGTLTWLALLFAPASLSGLQLAIQALPIIGLTPIIIAPLLGQNALVLWIHSLLSLVLLAAILRRNAQWFATHLEQI